ncbi:isoamylase early set domain-containing protein [Thermosipho atlanticus]|uniref:Carbohydrate-binding module 48 (Isoamylase N-terminal domain) n=1 Tax=Thermosipho atlanticus DSM 15807 TaxID=1123380 RepID=A0A1M5U1E6_9BACT|nr:isoamylase early set domain-containing protein [Thermosipho atlanticus]SHH56867.1 Carbohydrate-binding module 48 (Isoamylase N-terminal domain) [Thermosipho atlanticus DSM 15807]
MVKKIFILVILSIVILSFSNVYVENDKVFFSFEYDAEQVYLAGNFNNWSPTSLPMKNVNGIWMISLELQPGEYQYKFVVNGEQWIEDPDAPSFVDDGFGGKNGAFLLANENGKLVIKPVGESVEEKMEYEYNENREDTIFVDGEGYVVIRYYNPEADYVMIAGDFNDWDPESLEMYEIDDGWWEAVLELDPGVYQYKFVVNGEQWVEDPNAFAYAPDGFGGKNSVLEVYVENGRLSVKAPGLSGLTNEVVEKEVEEVPLGVSVINGKVYFKVEKKEASKAYLAGSFNNWDPQSIEMKMVDGYWQVSLELSPGSYQYKYVFIINGNQNWKEDPYSPAYVPDGFGGKNSAFNLVKKDGELTIEAPEEVSSQSQVGISGNYSFNLTYKYDPTNILQGVSFTNSLTLVFTPSDEINFALNFSGANIEYAQLNFGWKNFTIMAHYNTPIDYPIEGARNGIYIAYKDMLFGDIGINNNQVSFLVGINFNNFSVSYGSNYFNNENTILAGYNFDYLGIDSNVLGGVSIETFNPMVFLQINGSNWSVDLLYKENSLSTNFVMFKWEMLGKYSFLDGTYNFSLYVPVFEKFQLFGGYEHKISTDEFSGGLGLYDDDYNVNLGIRFEMSNIYIDIFGNVSF